VSDSTGKVTTQNIWREIAFTLTIHTDDETAKYYINNISLGFSDWGPD